MLRDTCIKVHVLSLQLGEQLMVRARAEQSRTYRRALVTCACLDVRIYILIPGFRVSIVRCSAIAGQI